MSSLRPVRVCETRFPRQKWLITPRIWACSDWTTEILSAIFIWSDLGVQKYAFYTWEIGFFLCKMGWTACAVFRFSFWYKDWLFLMKICELSIFGEMNVRYQWTLRSNIFKTTVKPPGLNDHFFRTSGQNVTEGMSEPRVMVGGVPHSSCKKQFHGCCCFVDLSLWFYFPSGTYLDPLKACALSGESGVNIGKSESATYTKYMNIVRQTRRTASRVSVLNDVERSRLNSVMRRIDGERAYSTAVLDRQKRQFKRSLDSLDKHKSGFTHHIDEIATPAHLRAKQSLLSNHRKHQVSSRGINRVWNMKLCTVSLPLCRP